MKSIYLLMTTLVLISSACTPAQQGAVTLAVPSSWKLESFGVSGAETPVIPDSNITLEILNNGQIGGSGGCNSYSASYEIQGNTLAVKDLVSTLMACMENNVSEQETQFFDALKSASKFEISGDRLIIYDDGKSQLNFITN